MFTKSRIIILSLLISVALIACGENTPSPTDVATTAIAAVTTDTIKAGTAEQEVIDSLGTPSYTQTRNIDDLTITYSEWTDEKGTLSVQFHNGKAQFNQFVAAPNQD